MSVKNVNYEMGNSEFRKASTTVITVFNVETSAGKQKMLSYGNTVPAAGSTGYHVSSLFIHADGASASDMLYVNEGTGTSSTFTALSSV